MNKNNIVDNAYGVYNVQLDGTTANTAVPVNAVNNWWGLRTGTVALPTAGPAVWLDVVTPTTINPPVPENPVNGTATADGPGTSSSSVDFYPCRNGPQGDPDSGQFVIVDPRRCRGDPDPFEPLHLVVVFQSLLPTLG